MLLQNSIKTLNNTNAKFLLKKYQITKQYYNRYELNGSPAYNGLKVKALESVKRLAVFS